MDYLAISSLRIRLGSLACPGATFCTPSTTTQSPALALPHNSTSVPTRSADFDRRMLTFARRPPPPLDSRLATPNTAPGDKQRVFLHAQSAAGLCLAAGPQNSSGFGTARRCESRPCSDSRRRKVECAVTWIGRGRRPKSIRGAASCQRQTRVVSVGTVCSKSEILSFRSP